MALRPIPKEQIDQTVQIALSILDSDAVNIPGNLAEGLSSAKSLLRGILQGNVTVCVESPDPEPAPEPEPEPDEE